MRAVLLYCLMVIIWDAPAMALQQTSLEVIVLDQHSELPFNVVVRLKNGEMKIREIKNMSERIIFSGIKSGKYSMEISADGFETQNLEVEVKNGKNQVVVNLQIAAIVENVIVEREKQEKSLDPQEGAFNNFLTREEIENLPDDPEELKKELKKRFGENVVIQVDGFSSGQTPPKAMIASIRVSRSTFDAEYHEIGSTIVNITSRAGGGSWNGSVSYSFNNSIFNSRNPFDTRRTPSYKGNYLAFLNGPILKNKASLFVLAFGNNSSETASITALTPFQKSNNTLSTPRSSFLVSTKLSYNVNDVTTLNAEYQISSSTSKNMGVGGFNLPDRAYDSKNIGHQLRISRTGYIGKSFLNEIRFQYTSERNEVTPVNKEATVIVLDAFSTGGAGNQNKIQTYTFSFADNLLFGIGKRQALKVGGLFEFERRNIESAANSNGTFIFSSLDDFKFNKPALFTQQSGHRKVNLSQIQIGAYIQDDVRLKKSLLISLGLRYEKQTNLGDENNFSPRIGFAWSPYKSGRTTFRGGAGVYYNWFDASSLVNILKQDVDQPGTIIISNPSYPNFELSQALTPRSYLKKDEKLKNPYVFLTSFGVQHQLTKRSTLSVLYKYKKGIHQFRNRDINAPVNLVRPDSDFGSITGVESSAFFLQNSLNIVYNSRLGRKFTYSVDYTLAKSISDSDGIFSLPSNNFNLKLDRSIADFDRRHRLYASVFWQVGKNINFSTNLVANSPLPYTITTGFDENKDGVFNDRPIGTLRNSMRGAWQRQVDVSGSWNIPLGKLKPGQTRSPGMIVTTSGSNGGGNGGFNENHRFSLRIYSTVYNVFNQKNFNSFVGVQTSPFFRQPVTANNTRKGEFGLKFSF